MSAPEWAVKILDLFYAKSYIHTTNALGRKEMLEIIQRCHAEGECEMAKALRRMVMLVAGTSAVAELPYIEAVAALQKHEGVG